MREIIENLVIGSHGYIKRVLKVFSAHRSAAERAGEQHMELLWSEMMTRAMIEIRFLERYISKDMGIELPVMKIDKMVVEKTSREEYVKMFEELNEHVKDVFEAGVKCREIVPPEMFEKYVDFFERDVTKCVNDNIKVTNGYLSTQYEEIKLKA